MSAKQIFHLIPNLNSGGCENQLLRLLPRVKGQNHTVVTLLEEGVLAPEFRKAGIKVVCLNIGSFKKFWRYRRILNYIKSENPDKIITYLFVPDLIGRLLIQPFSKYRPVPFLRSTYLSPSFSFVFIRFIERITQPLVKSYLANSYSVKRAFVEKVGVPARKITVVPNGINIDKFQQTEKLGEKRRDLGLSPDELVITCVANLHKGKGQRFLIEAVSRVVNRHPSTSLLLVGDGEEAVNLKNQTETLNISSRVHFLGRRSDVIEILRAADIFVLPTSFEGMSNALMEAMAVGLPCIATDIEPNMELIENGKSGRLVPVADSIALAKQITYLAENINARKELAQAARQKIRDCYDINIVAEKFENFLHGN